MRATDGVWEYVSNRQAVRLVEANLRLNVNEPCRAQLAALTDEEQQAVIDAYWAAKHAHGAGLLK